MLTHNLHNFSELEDRIALLHMQQKEVNTSVVSLESQIRHLREMLKYAEQYQKNKIYDDHYKSSKDPDRYFRKYESQIILFAGAEHILQENGIDLKHLNSNKLQEQIADLISRKESLNTQYVSFKQEIKELELIHQNLSKYLKQDAPEIQRSSHNQLPSLYNHNNRQRFHLLPKFPLNRYPTPRTVCIYNGCPGSSSIFSLILQICRITTL